MAEVKIRELFKSYGNTEVIHGLDVDIEDGEFVVLGTFRLWKVYSFENDCWFRRYIVWKDNDW